MSPIFTIEGKVEKGKSRGKNLGFPTANFSANPTLPQGTFISEVNLMEKTYPAITFIGTVDTFNEKDFVAETYILDFDKNIYEEFIEVKILKKLRDNKKFSSEKELVNQMETDKKEAIEFFKNLLKS